MFTFTMNDKTVKAEKGETILEVAKRNKIDIPTLCHADFLDPAGMCRVCTVELFDGRRTKMVTACNYPVWEGMEVRTDTESVRSGRKLILELLLARCPDSKSLREMAGEYDIDQSRFPVEEKGCTVCGMCVRACDQYAGKALSLSGRSDEIKVDTPFCQVSDDCIGCGICAYVCPTGKMRIEERDGERYIVHEDQVIGKLKLAQCSACGELLETDALINVVKARMGKGYVPAHVSMCNECARRAVAEQMVKSWEMCW